MSKRAAGAPASGSSNRLGMPPPFAPRNAALLFQRLADHPGIRGTPAMHYVVDLRASV